MVSLLVNAAGCGGGGDGGTAPPPVTVASVGVALASGSVTVGQSTTATATARDAQGSAIGGKTASWSSSNASVATVAASGQVTGVAVGSADIIATIDGKTGQATVTVTPVPVAAVAVTLNASSISVGQTTQGAAVTRDAQGNALTGRTIAWSSSNTAVATVSVAGLVTGVSPGTANIIATSEGQSGQAAITVSPGVSVSGLTLTTAGGAPLDTNNVAGSFSLSTDVELPTGFRGVRTIRLDTIVVARDSVFGTSSLSARVVPFQRAIETTSATRVLTAGELTSTPHYPNGRHVVDFTVIGQLPNGTTITRTVQSAIHTRNANTFRLFVEPARRVTLIDGRTIETGTLTGQLDIVAFDQAAVSEIEIVRAPAQATYGSNPIAGVLTVATLRGSDLRKPFNLLAANYESPDAGTRYLIERIIAGDVTYFPRQAPISVSGNTPSVDGSGWATPASIAGGISLSGGLRYQPSAPFPPGVLSANYSEWSTGARLIDNLAPRGAAGFLTPYDRNYTVGARAWSPTGKLGLSMNYLGAGTTAADFLDTGKLQSDLSGLPTASGFTWYRGNALGTLFQPGNLITSWSAIPASLTRDFYLGARASDGAGNVGEWVVTTTAENPYTTGNVVSPSTQYGIAPGLWGKLDLTGSLTRTGARSGSVFNAAGVAASSHAWEVTGVSYKPNAAFGTLRNYLNPADCYRGYDNCTTPQVLGGSVNTSTGKFSYSDPISAMIAARVARSGGSGDGLYAGEYWAGDLGGNIPPWSSMGMGMGSGWWGGLVDRSTPTADGSITVNSINNVSYTVSATDPLAIESVGLGARFDLTHSLFPGGKLFAWLDWLPLGGDLSTGLSTSVSQTFTGEAITHGAFFTNSTGIASAPFYPVLGGTVQSRDWAWNYSLLRHIGVANAFPTPTIPAGVTYHFSLGGSSVCRDFTCPVGQSNLLDWYMDVRSPTSTPPVTKAAFQLIPIAGGAVYHVGTDDTPVTTQVGSLYNHRYTVQWDAHRACIPPGTFFAKVMVVALVHHLAFFNGTFLNLNVTGSNTPCTKAARSLNFSYPPPAPPALQAPARVIAPPATRSTPPRARPAR